jgi:hypothetical protein
MARRSQPYRLHWPLSPAQVENIDEMFQLLFDDTDNGTMRVRANQIYTGTLAVERGGTGIGSYTIGDVLYASASTTLSRLAGVATGNALISGGVATAPSWGKIGLTTHVSGVLPVANGGTNLASYAIGDILYASGATALAKLADVAAGSYLRSGGVGAAPVWSTVTLPNTATTGDLWYASASNVISARAAVAAGSYLRSAGLTTAPVWSTLTIPNASAQGDLFLSTAANAMTVLAKNTTATRYLSNTGTSNNPAWAQVNLADGVTGNLPIANLGNGTFTRVTSTVTGSNNNLNIGVVGNTYCEWSGASDATITGITLGASGKLLIIKNTGSAVAYFPDNSGSSSAANRFQNYVSSGSTPIAAGGYIAYMHNGTDWQIVGHDQGVYITPTFAAGDFTLNGDRTWTVDAGDVVNYRWKLSGTTLHVMWVLSPTTISGGTSSSIAQIAVPNSFVATVQTLMLASYFIFTGAFLQYAGYSSIATSGTVIQAVKIDQTDFGTGTNDMRFYGQLQFQVN